MKIKSGRFNYFLFDKHYCFPIDKRMAIKIAFQLVLLSIMDFLKKLRRVVRKWK